METKLGYAIKAITVVTLIITAVITTRIHLGQEATIALIGTLIVIHLMSEQNM